MREFLRRGLKLVGGAKEAPPADPDARRRPLWVITLSISPTPLPLPQGRQLPEIGGLTVFRAKRRHGSKEMHLQQLGYFDSRLAAEALLPQLEREWPAAVVDVATPGAMGSLDDTAITQFQVLRAPPSAESGAAIGDPPGRDPADTDAPPAGAAAAEQSYAVQLIRQATPIDLAKVPRLAIFQDYALYRVQSERDGIRTFGLRLGFFSDPASAALVADYVRAQFPRAALVPVSAREVARVAKGGAQR